MTAWTVAESLDRLLAQLNALAPHRSKVSDGSIGDEAHQKAGTSDHLPRLIAGARLVTARDFTTDPAAGLDCAKLRDALVKAKDSRVKYIIFNRQIISGSGGPEPWKARPYSGANAHKHHLHLSVVGDKRCRDNSPWMLPGMTGGAGGADGLPTLKQGDKGSAVEALQRFLNAEPWRPPLPVLKPDGDYGLATVAVVRAAQEQCGVTGPDADGTIVGPRTNRAFAARGYRG